MPSKQDTSRLHITNLILTNFRNYQSLQLDTGGNSVVLTGQNGAGKTNVLEAISLLIPGRGLRLAKFEDLAHRSSLLPWGVKVTAQTMVGESIIGTAQSTDSKTRRSIRINGANTTQIELENYLSCIWLTPQMDGLFTSGTTARRRFLDRLIWGFDKHHIRRIRDYSRGLYARSILLKKSKKAEEDWLNVIEWEIVRHGVAIAAARILMIERINAVTCFNAPPFPRAMMSIDGSVENWLQNHNAQETEDIFRRALRDGRDGDALTASTRIGTHRSDVLVEHLEKSIDASLCSTGEQKGLLIAIIFSVVKLQKLETGYTPVLLLDDIATHLDKTRYSAVFDAVDSLGPQVWYTGVHPTTFSCLPKDHQRFSVHNNMIDRA